MVKKAGVVVARSGPVNSGLIVATISATLTGCWMQISPTASRHRGARARTGAAVELELCCVCGRRLRGAGGRLLFRKKCESIGSWHAVQRLVRICLHEGASRYSCDRVFHGVREAGGLLASEVAPTRERSRRLCHFRGVWTGGKGYCYFGIPQACAPPRRRRPLHTHRRASRRGLALRREQLGPVGRVGGCRSAGGSRRAVG